MATLWEIGLANALVVAIVAPVAFVVARAARRPAWVHAVWVIVLLKLVTPPVASWPVARSWAKEAEPVAAVPMEVVEAPAVRVQTPIRRVAKVPVEPVAVEPVVVPLKVKRAVSVSRVLGMAWLMGSGFWVMVAAWRIARFARAVRRADEAPDDLVEWVEELSGQIGLARSPRVVLAPVRVAPMVWALGGRACLLVPEALWDRLDREQRAAMLIHELAHLRRRDHWVRLLELVATGLYWWHPALWLARRELHRAEEECCDLWVVWALPKAKRGYASALVEAVEFLSEARPKGLPIGASGMGQVEDLSRRIGMIMRGDTPRGLTRAGSLAALGLGLLLLPWRPTIAQDAPKPEEPRPPAQTTKAEEKTSVDPTKGSTLEQELKRAEERLRWSEEMLKKRYVSEAQVAADRLSLMNTRKQLEALRPDEDDPFASAREQIKVAQMKEQQLEQMHKQGVVSFSEVTAAHAGVLEMKARLAVLEAQARRDVEVHKFAIQDAQDAVETAMGNLRTHDAHVAKAEAQRNVAAAELAYTERLAERQGVSKVEVEQYKGKLAVADAVVREAKAEQDQARIEVAQAERRFAALKNQPNAAFTTITTKRNARTAGALGLKAVAEHPLAKNSPDDPAAEFTKVTPRDANARIDELEAKLDRILKELEAMRREKGKEQAKDEAKSPNPSRQ